MKSYILILIRISIVNFIGVLLVVVYFTNRPALSNASRSGRATSSPIAYVPAQVTSSQVPSEEESASPDDSSSPSPSVSDIPIVTAKATATPKPSPTRTAVASATVAVTSTPASTVSPTNTPAPTQTQAPTPTPTPQPTATPVPTQARMDPLLARVAPHNTQNDCWMVIDQKVYNVSDYMTLHPGGKDPLLKYCGKDGTTGYHTKDLNPPKEHSSSSNQMLDMFLQP